MSAVLLMVAALQADAALSSTARQRLRQIEDEVEWMAEMLAASEGDDASPQVVDVATVLQQPLTVASAVSACRLRLRQMPGVRVHVDPVGLRRAMRNLIDNATRAAGPQGRVHVTVRRTVNEAVLEVADSGPGFGRMPRQQGLGLLTVRRFVDGAGGTLAVGGSTLGGARVTIRLPLAVPDLCADHGDSA